MPLIKCFIIKKWQSNWNPALAFSAKLHFKMFKNSGSVVSVKTSQMRTICTLIWRESCLLVYIFTSLLFWGGTFLQICIFHRWASLTRNFKGLTFQKAKTIRRSSIELYLFKTMQSPSTGEIRIYRKKPPQKILRWPLPSKAGTFYMHLARFLWRRHVALGSG